MDCKEDFIFTNKNLCFINICRSAIAKNNEINTFYAYLYYKILTLIFDKTANSQSKTLLSVKALHLVPFYLYDTRWRLATEIGTEAANSDGPQKKTVWDV